MIHSVAVEPVENRGAIRIAANYVLNQVAFEGRGRGNANRSLGNLDEKEMRQAKIESKLNEKARKVEGLTRAKQVANEVRRKRLEMGEKLHAAICCVKRGKGGRWTVPNGSIFVCW